MLNMIKKINKVLRVIFIGFIAIYGIVKIFDIVPKEKRQETAAEDRTSEFDELW